MNISLDGSASAQTPDPTPVPTLGFATVPTPVPEPIPAPIQIPAYQVDLSVAAQIEPTELGVKRSLKLL